MDPTKKLFNTKEHSPSNLSRSFHGDTDLIELINSATKSKNHDYAAIGSDTNSNKEQIDHYYSSFESINPILLKKLADKQQTVLVVEITPNSDTTYKQLSLRDLLAYINKEAVTIDASNSKPNGTINPSTTNSNSSLEELINEDNRLRSSVYDRRKESVVGLLKHRDLRRLEFQFNPLGEPTILVRRHAVLISLDPLRCIVMADKLILIIPDGLDSVLQILGDHLNAWNDVGENDAISFEARAYEAILATIIDIQRHEFGLLQHEASTIMLDFKQASIIPVDKQERMRMLKNRVTGMLSRILAYKRALVELLEEDQDLALLNLTKLKNKSTLYNLPLSNEILSSHEEMEVLLESYLMDYNSIESKVTFLQSQILNAEESVLLRLDTSRNQLLIADTIISVITCSLALGSFIGALYGMNLKNHHEEDDNTFYTITIITILGMLLVVIVSLFYFRLSGMIPAYSKYFTVMVNNTIIVVSIKGTRMKNAIGLVSK
eukprot:gene18929-24736_t